MDETVPKWRDPHFAGLAFWGAAVALAGYPPVGYWWLVLVGLAPLFAVCPGCAPRRALRLGFGFGLGWFGGLVWWLVHTLGVFGNMPWIAGLALTILLVFYLSLFPAACAGLIAWAARKNPAAALVAAPFAWTGLEWLRGTLFTGFPWGDLPQALWRVGWALDLAPWVGIDGVRLLVAAIAAALAWGWLRFGPAKLWIPVWATGPAVVFVATAAILLAVGSPAPSATEPIHVAVVQGNIAQDQKWEPAFKARTLESYQQLTRQTLKGQGEKVDFILFPETAVPLWIQEPSAGRKKVEEIARQSDTPLVFGAPAYDETPVGVMHRNSVFVMDDKGTLGGGRHDKVHLVPFGEFVPSGRYFPFIKRIVTAAGDFTPGARPRLVNAGKIPVGPLICFESIFPSYAAQHARSGAQILAVVTNDAWFGITPAPYHHLAFAAWRAAETGLPLVRAANTGVSAAFDARGRLVTSTELTQQAGFTVELMAPPGADTPQRWVRPWISPLSLLLALWIVFVMLRHRPDAEGESTA